MPYSVESPPDAARKYKPRCQRAFVHAFNSVYDRSKDEGRAMAAGHAAAQRCEGKRSSMSDVKFNIYAPLLKAYQSDDGVKRLKTTASSTIRDLAGDTISLNALQKMARTAEQNMTLFLNHNYRVPEDVLGSVETAAVNAHGSDIFDLDFDIRVEESNPRAVKTWEAINNGTKLGTSIGAKIPEGGAVRNKDGLMIDDVILLEASIVGIPANPRSFVHYAVKAYVEAEAEEEEDLLENSALPDTEKAKVWVTVDTEDTNGEEDAASNGMSTSKPKTESKPAAKKDVEDVEVVADAAESEDVDAELLKETPADDLPDEIIDETAGPDDAPRHDDADGAPPEGDEGAADSESPATQEAQTESDPESAGDGDDPADAMVGKTVEVMRATLKAASEELVDLRKQLADETVAREAAERGLGEAKESLKLAQQFVERIAALPIGRRTSFAGEVTAFRTKFSGLYSDDVLELLEK